MGKKGKRDKWVESSVSEKELRRELFRRSLHLLGPYWRQISVAILAMVAEALLSVFRPWPLKIVIDRVLSHKPSRVPFLHAWLDNAPFTQIEILYGACATTILIALLAGLLTYYFTHTMGNVGQNFVFAFRCSLFGHVQRLSLRFHNRQKTGDLTHRVVSDIREIQDMVSGGITALATNVFLLAGILILLFWVHWRLPLVSLSASPLLYCTAFRYKRPIKIAHRKARKSTGALPAP